MLTQTAIRNGSFKQPATQPLRAPLPGTALQTGTIELMGACMCFAANEEIYGENEPAEAGSGQNRGNEQQVGRGVSQDRRERQPDQERDRHGERRKRIPKRLPPDKKPMLESA